MPLQFRSSAAVMAQTAAISTQDVGRIDARQALPNGLISDGLVCGSEPVDG